MSDPSNSLPLKDAASTVSWWKTVLSDAEADAAKLAVSSGRLSQGALTSELETRLAESLGVKYVTMTTSGSVALTSSLLVAGIGPGDAIIISNRTFIASAHAALLLGAKVQVIDTLPGTPLIDPNQIENTISPRTKAIMPTHMNGRACDMPLINAIAERHGLVVIEDAAQALFSKSPHGYLGTLGDIGCFSLGVTKFMTSGQGGFITTNNPNYHEGLQRMRFHGVSSPRAEAYQHFGFNFRYTDIQAAIALIQMDRLDAKLKAHRELYIRYMNAISNYASLKMVDVNLHSGELPLWIEVACEERQLLRDMLNEHNIETSVAMSNLSESNHLEQSGVFPNAEYFDRTMLTLPSGPDQPNEAIEKTLNVLSAFEARYRNNHSSISEGEA